MKNLKKYKMIFYKHSAYYRYAMESLRRLEELEIKDKKIKKILSERAEKELKKRTLVENFVMLQFGIDLKEERGIIF